MLYFLGFRLQQPVYWQTWVVNSGIPNVYYTSQKTYRLLDALTQEYYYTYHWYSDPVYTNLITSEQTGTYTIYFG